MTLANSLWSQYMGTTAGHGLAHVFKTLNRKGLQEATNKGPFHHHLHEALLHALEAHILCCWLRVSKKEKVSELLSATPAKLIAWANEIEQKYTSSEAVDDVPPGADDTFRGAVMFMRDTLVYLELYKAMRAGDCGCMERLIPDLLFCFSGSSNPKYTILFQELVQGIQHEWPPEVK